MRRRARRFLLTGSAKVLTLTRIADSLAGRMETIQLLPLAKVEGRDGDVPRSSFELHSYRTFAHLKCAKVLDIDHLRADFPASEMRERP